MLPNPYVIIGAIVGWIATLAAVGWLMYDRGRDDMRNAYTEQQLVVANHNLATVAANNKLANAADQQHQAGVQVVHDTTREIVRTVTLPPSADVYLPVGFVRLLDRAASRNPAADPYPGKSDGDPSDVKVSEAQSLLAGIDGWSDDYYACRQQVIDTGKLNPVMPPLPVERKSFFESINPF